jgi:hypothetical protein
MQFHVPPHWLRVARCYFEKQQAKAHFDQPAPKYSHSLGSLPSIFIEIFFFGLISLTRGMA